MNGKKESAPRPEDAQVEPLFAALEGGGPPKKGPSLGLRIFWAALVLIALLLLVLKQAY